MNKPRLRAPEISPLLRPEPPQKRSRMVTISHPENVVALAMQPITSMVVPDTLRASIERQGRNLMELAIGLLHAGMDEARVRTVINQASASYREELICTIISLKRAP